MLLLGTKGLFVLKHIGKEPSKNIFMWAAASWTLNGKFIVIASTMALILLFGCTDDASRDKMPQSLKSGNMGSGNNLRIVIHWPGDDFASQKDLETRDKIEGLIVNRKVGKIIRLGTGMGWMDILIAVKDKTAAGPEIRKIIETVDPTVKYVIE
jgi:hypothetical protein